jgi:hypothetical protein
LGTWGYPNVYVQDGQEGWLTSAHSRPVMIAHLEGGAGGDAEVVPEFAVLE